MDDDSSESMGQPLRSGVVRQGLSNMHAQLYLGGSCTNGPMIHNVESIITRHSPVILSLLHLRTQYSIFPLHERNVVSRSGSYCLGPIVWWMGASPQAAV